MEKKTLISFLESVKDSGVEMNNFIQAIYEVRPDIMELERNTPKGGMYDITDKSNPSKAIDDFSDDEPELSKSEPKKQPHKQQPKPSTDKPVVEPSKESESKPEPPKEPEKEKQEQAQEPKDAEPKGLTIKSDIGYKRVADNDAFKNINEETYQPIADIFSLDEVKMINESVPTDWHEADRRLIMCKQVDYEDTSRKVINCYNGSNPTGLGRPNKFPREYITTFYDAVQSGKLKDANEVYTIFHVKDSYRSSPIHVLQLREKKGRNRYAIKFHVLGEESPYLMIGSELHTKFLFKIY